MSVCGSIRCLTSTGVTTLTMSVSGEEDNSEILSGIERLWKFSGKHDVSGTLQEKFGTSTPRGMLICTQFR